MIGILKVASEMVKGNNSTFTRVLALMGLSAKKVKPNYS